MNSQLKCKDCNESRYSTSKYCKRHYCYNVTVKKYQKQEAPKAAFRSSKASIKISIKENEELTCGTCFTDIFQTKGHHICESKHILCIDCILKISETKEFLCCYCNDQVCFQKIMFDDERNRKMFFASYLLFYERKYHESFIEMNGKRVSAYFAGEVDAKLSIIKNKLTPLIKSYSEVYKTFSDIDEPIVIKETNIAGIRRIPIKCIDNNCDGKIGQQNQCDKCNLVICEYCECAKHEGECDPDIMKSIKLMKENQDFVVCPYCSIRIKREQGCPNVECTCGNQMNIIDVKQSPYWKNDLCSKLKNYKALRNKIQSKQYKEDTFLQFMKLVVIPNEAAKNADYRYYREFSKQVCRLIQRSQQN